MRVFNALQIVMLYAAGPSLLGWMFTNPFAYATIVAWIGCVGYAVLTGILIAAVVTATLAWEW